MSNLDLAKRAVACNHWRWKSGMRTTCGILSGGDYWVPFGYDDKDMVVLNHDGRWLPDLTDAATLGCLLSLVREAWDDPGLHCAGRYGSGEWTWHVAGGKPHGAAFRRHVYAIGHATEAEALVAALEAANV